MSDSSDNFQMLMAQARLAYKLEPDNPDLACRLALMQSSTGDYPSAFLTLSAFVRDHPNHFNTLVDLALTEMMLEDFENAAEHFRRALKIDPGNEDVKRHLDYFS